MAFFWQPKKIREKGMLSAGAIIGALSFGSPFVFGGIVARLIGIDLSNPDNSMALGFAIGAVSYGLISFVENWLSKREDKDIGEVLKDVKSNIKDSL
jgi:hypothetical protein